VPRLATYEDIPLMVPMGRRFHTASGFASYSDFNATDFADAIETLIDDECGLVLLSDRGMMGAAIGQLWYDKSITCAEELFWWSEDGSGLKMLKMAEEWARERGAKAMRMGCIVNDNLPRMDRLYDRLQYGAREAMYMKVF